MTPYYDANGVQIFHGDALQVLKMLPDQSVNCCVSSPPYWGLRDYGTATWEGGDEKCDHLPGRETSRATGKNATNTGSSHQWKDFCRKCDAVRVDSQLGLESTPEEYVFKLVEIFREIRRVLASDSLMIQEITRLYDSGMTQLEIAKVLGVSQKVIWSKMKKFGIKSRVAAKRNQFGENNSSWKGAEASYQALHLRVERLRGKPYNCESCGTNDPNKTYDWANLTGNYSNPSDYKRLCRSCHAKRDDKIQNIRRSRC